MQLFLGSSERTIDSPSDDDIARILATEDDFAIISDGPESLTYMQFAWANEEPWGVLLEYQSGSLGRHFVATNQDLTLEQIIEAFQQYAKGNEAWKNNYSWKRQ